MNIKVANRIIGSGEPCFVAAEIGINHNGDMNLAHQMIDAAADAGADAVKFQNYRTEDFIADHSMTYEYISQGKHVTESQYTMFKRCELRSSALNELRAHSEQRNLVFFSTPTSDSGVADLVQAGAPLLKNGSDYLLHLPLIRTMAKTGLPTVISTGMATLGEIEDAVTAFRGEGNQQLVLLVCTSAYPTPADQVNLARLATLRTAFNCIVGFSDHTEGYVATVGAVALGANFIEKHFTLDKNLPGPDHRFSADPSEFRALVNAIRTIETNLGESTIGPTSVESEARGYARLSCVASTDLPFGHVLCDMDVAYQRPGTGLPPKASTWLIGRKLSRPLTRGHVFVPADFA